MARPLPESFAWRMYRAQQQAFAEPAERRASDRGRGGADYYYGNDEHEGDDEGGFYVPQTQVL